MIKFIIILSTIFLAATTALAQTAIRPIGVDYKSVAKALLENDTHKIFPNDENRKKTSAWDLRRPYRELNFSPIPDWEDFEQISLGFEYFRDLQFIDHKQKLRRSSWMYPDDGCWIRAELAGKNLADKNFEIYKIFIFGNLKVKTDFSPSGHVSWWYHVVPVVKFGEKVFALDPAIESSRPLPLKKWIKRQSQTSSKLQFTLCPASTFGPGDPCEIGAPLSRKVVETKQIRFLEAEERRLESLDLDTELLLGEEPPWLSPSRPSRTKNL